MTENRYDVIILGTGPAGLTAALYAQRLGLSAVVLGDTPGGNMYMIESLMNYPGFSGGVPGTQLGVTVFQQAQQEGAFFTMALLDKLRADDQGGFTGVDANGQTWRAPRAIVATGRTPKTLDASNSGLQGVHFCSICDGPLFRGKDAALAVIGGENPAAQHALSLSRIAKKVLLISKADRFGMDAVHEKQIMEQPNIDPLLNTRVKGYKGLAIIEAIVVSEGEEEKELPVDGVFLAVGWTPNTGMLDIPVEKTPEGYLKTDETLMTSHPGLFAAGDVRDTDMQQVLTACADGARAAMHASRFKQSA